MGFGDNIRMGLSDALSWASDKAEAGAKMVGEAVDAAKDAVVKTATDAVVKTAEVIGSPLISIAPKEAPKPASLSTTVQGVNSDFTDKVAYAWKKTTEMTSALGTYAAMLSPATSGVVVASKLISVGHNIYQNKETGDRVQILDKDKSVTSVLQDTAWQSALTKSEAGKTSVEGNPSIDTDKLKSNLPAAETDNGSDRQRRGRRGGDNYITAHVSGDEWRQILKDSKEAEGAIPDATVDSDGILIRASNSAETAVEGEVKVGKDSVTHDDKKGNTVEFDAKAQRFQARGATYGTNVEVDRTTGKVEATIEGKGYRVVEGKKIWDISNNQTVELDDKGIYSVYDAAHNLLQTIEKGKVTDYRGKDQFIRLTGPCRKVREIRDQHKADAEASGLVLGAAEDGIFMRDKDGTAVVLQTDGNAFFELSGGVKIWKDVNDKYYIIEAGKQPQEILDGAASAVEQEARQYLGLLKGWANDKTFTRNGVKFTNVDGKLNVEMDDGKTSMQTSPAGLTLNLADRPASTLTLTNETQLTIGEGKNKTTINVENQIVDTPYVRTDKLGTTIKETGDWVGHNLEVKLADGTHFDQKGDVHFADGTIFHQNGEVTVGNGVKLAADVQEQQIKQAATVLRNAEAIADAVKAKAASGLISYDLIAQLEGSISQVGALMAMFSGNDAIRARLSMVMASLESARSDAKSSFASNTALRATRDAALANNKVKPESVVLNSNYNPELKMQFRIGKIDRLAA